MKSFFKERKYISLLIFVVLAVALSTITVICLINLGKLPAILSWIASIISPFIYGFAFAYLCNPVMKFVENKLLRFKTEKKWKLKLKRVIAIVITCLFVSLIVILFVFLVIPQVALSYNNLVSQISTYISAAQSWADNFVRNFWLFNGQYENFSHFLDATKIVENIKGFINNSYDILQAVATYLISQVENIVIELKNIVMGIIVCIYFLMAKESLLAKAKRTLAALLPRRQYINTINLARYTNSTFSGFISGKILDSFIIGLISFIVFGIFDLPYYQLISVIVGVTNVIPFFGPFIGAIPSAFIIFIAEPDKTILFLILILIIQQLDGNVIGPHILGDSTGLSALGVLVAITVAGGIFGIAGMFLGVPAFAVITNIAKQYIDRRLRKKAMPTELDYYRKPQDFDPSRPIFFYKDDPLPTEEDSNSAEGISKDDEKEATQ